MTNYSEDCVAVKTIRTKQVDNMSIRARVLMIAIAFALALTAIPPPS
jgi:hypothetical protein